MYLDMKELKKLQKKMMILRNLWKKDGVDNVKKLA
jgi:hypothetical protein